MAKHPNRRTEYARWTSLMAKLENEITSGRASRKERAKKGAKDGKDGKDGKT